MGAILGSRDALGGVLGASWGDVGAPRTPVEASWGRPGVIFWVPGRPWRRLGGIVGRFLGSPDARGDVLGASRGDFLGARAPLEASRGRLGVSWGRLEASWDDFGPSRAVLGRL